MGSVVSDACTTGEDLFMTLLCFLFFRYLSTDAVCMDLIVCFMCAMFALFGVAMLMV